jgi:hypothetical protein
MPSADSKLGGGQAEVARAEPAAIQAAVLYRRAIGPGWPVSWSRRRKPAQHGGRSAGFSE